MTPASQMPTCSIPIAVQLSPTVWRHISRSDTSWWITPLPVDHEVRADARQLVQLDVGHVAARTCRRRTGSLAAREVLDDHVRVASR